MQNKNLLYEMRGNYYTQGLVDLIDHVKTFGDTKQMTMIEIGSYAGESTEIFSQHFKSVLAIDPFINDYDPNDLTCSYMDLTDVYHRFYDRIKDILNIMHIRKTSDDAFPLLGGQQFDFIYIDGLHTYDQLKKDIANYRTLIKPTGLMGGHDYHPNWSGIMAGVDEFLGGPDKTFSDTSWIKKL